MCTTHFFVYVKLVSTSLILFNRNRQSKQGIKYSNEKNPYFYYTPERFASIGGRSPLGGIVKIGVFVRNLKITNKFVQKLNELKHY